MDSIPIIQLRQPWAWATMSGFRHTHGISSPVFSAGNPVRRMRETKTDRGIMAVVSSTTLQRVGQTIKWLWENDVAVPRMAELPFGALLGFVDVVDCVRRSSLSESLFLDEHPWQLVLTDPLPLAKPVLRRFWNVTEGLAVDTAIELLARRRDALGKSYAERIQAMEEAGLASAS